MTHHERPDLRDPAAILALPVYRIGRVVLTSDEHCEAHYWGKTIRTSRPHQQITVPVMPRDLAKLHCGDDVMFAVDSHGEMWEALQTADGWFRRRVI